jgi:hypothetical protein
VSYKNRLDDYQLFFMEIPSQSVEDLDDIQIIDASEETPQQVGLSDDQVSQISSDTLNQEPAQPQVNQSQASFNEQRQLFDN